MLHTIEWDNEEQTVVYQCYLRRATKDDLYALATKSADMLASVSHTVHLIIDERETHLFINNDDMLFLEEHVPANQGRVVMIPPVGSDAYKKTVNRLAHRTAPRAFDELLFARDLEEAREMLVQVAGVKYP